MFKNIKGFIGGILFVFSYAILKFGGICLKNIDRFIAATFFQKTLVITCFTLLGFTFYTYPIYSLYIATYFGVVLLLARFMSINKMKHPN